MKKKNKIKLDLVNKRISIYIYVVIILFSGVLLGLFRVIYIDGGGYREKLVVLNNVIVEGESAPRGRIYDRNYKLLVDNIAIPTIVYKKVEGSTTKDEIDLAYKIIEKIDLPYQKLVLRNLKEFFLVTHEEICNSKITEEEWEKVERRLLTYQDIENLKISRISEDDLNILNESDKKAAYLYYLMRSGYSYQEKIIKKDVTDEEYSYFAENECYGSGFYTEIRWGREYLYGDSFRQILGSVGSITRESKDYYVEKGYNLNEIVGVSYLEKQYEEYLRGTKSTFRKVTSTKLEELTGEKRGNDIVLTIDIDLQMKVEEILKEELKKAKREANTEFFNKSYVVIQEPDTGEVLAMSGVQIIRKNNEYKYVDVTSGILTDPMTPGSVVKGGSILVGYNTNSIKINEYITDECIKIKSTPAKCSSHKIGRVNDIKALAESSNVYQFKIAIRVGKGNYRYDQPLKLDDKAFDIYRETFKELGLGVKTGIDLPIESLGYIGTKKDTNLLLNLAIGQYDTYTPIQLSQYITTLASNGNRVRPHLLKEVRSATSDESFGDVMFVFEPEVLNKVNTKQEYLDRVKEGFRAVVSYGTGKNVMGSAPDPAGKTGTSESFLDTNQDGKIDTETVSNAFVGYAPASKPEMTITVTSPDVENPNTSISFHSYVNRRIAKEISNYYFSVRN